MKTLDEARAALIAAAHTLADAATKLDESEAEAYDWRTLREALQAFADADVAHADARDREAKADPTLEDKLHAAVSAWLKRVAPALARSESCEAELSLCLHGAGSEDDGTLALSWNSEERLRGPVYDEERTGRVPGVGGP